MQATVLISKKGKVTIKKKQIQAERQVDLSHNKVKKYILQEGTLVPFLVDLGVQTKEGKIVRSNYDKFRQINRYLEFIADIMPNFPEDRPINIIDFGCGKSYLTFALYYYMKIQDEDLSTCKQTTDDGEELVWLPIEDIKMSKIKPEFIKENIDKIINGNQTIHVIEERDR